MHSAADQLCTFPLDPRPHTQAPTDDLGDFVSFDEIPPPQSPPRVPARSHTWTSTTREFDGDSVLLTLHEELIDFGLAFQPTRAELAARADLMQRMRAVVATVWPTAEVRAFGSYDTDLFLPESDIDIVCLNTGVKASQKHRALALQRLGAAIRKARWPKAELTVIGKARVPIVKFVDGESGIAVDVCLEERSGLRSSQLARAAARQFPQFRILVLVLKRFLNTRGLHDTFTGGVGSFLLQLLVISALQHPPKERQCLRGNLASQVRATPNAPRRPDRRARRPSRRARRPDRRARRPDRRGGS